MTAQLTAQSNHTLTNSEPKRRLFSAAQKALILTPAQIKGVADFIYYHLSYVYLIEHLTSLIKNTQGISPKVTQYHSPGHKERFATNKEPQLKFSHVLHWISFFLGGVVQE